MILRNLTDFFYRKNVSFYIKIVKIRAVFNILLMFFFNFQSSGSGSAPTDPPAPSSGCGPEDSGSKMVMTLAAPPGLPVISGSTTTTEDDEGDGGDVDGDRGRLRALLTGLGVVGAFLDRDGLRRVCEAVGMERLPDEVRAKNLEKI